MTHEQYLWSAVCRLDFALLPFIEKSVKGRKNVYFRFVDSEEAHDQAKELELWNVLHRYGVEIWLLNLVRVVYD